MCRTFIQSFFVIGPEDDAEDEGDASASFRDESRPPTSWRQRLNNFNHRYAMAMGLQEN
jgi:hypothetical protein